MVGLAGNRVDRGEAGDIALELPGHRVGLSGIAGDVDGRRRIGVYGETGRVVLLRRQQAAQIGVDLADLRVGARHVHAVTIGRRGVAADKVVVFVWGDDEQRVARADAVGGKTVEEF